MLFFLLWKIKIVLKIILFLLEFFSNKDGSINYLSNILPTHSSNNSYKEFSAADNILENTFPREILIEIFSSLDLEDLFPIALTSKNWHVLSNDPLLLKKIIFFKKTFNPIDWKLHFKDDPFIQKISDMATEEAFNALPNNIGVRFKAQCLHFPKMQMGKSHTIVWIQAGLTLNRYASLLDSKFEHNLFSKSFIEKYGNEPIETSRWLIMPTRILVKNINQENFVKHIIALHGIDYFIPSALEALICMASTYFKFGIKMFGIDNIECKEKLKEDQIITGFTSQNSLRAVTCHESFSWLGYAPAHTF